jgi:GntR family transcriptional regulator/MocR family aminotransferase
MQRRYRARRDAMVSALRAQFGDDVAIEGADAGAHFIVWLRGLPAARTDDFVAACRARGVGVYPAHNALTVYSERAIAQRLTRCTGLLLGYGMVDLIRIPRGMRVLGNVYRDLKRRVAHPRRD